MMKSIVLPLIVALLGVVVLAQKSTGPGNGTAEKTFAAEKELARLTVIAHGGDKLKGMRSLFISGSVDVTTSACPAFPDVVDPVLDARSTVSYL